MKKAHEFAAAWRMGACAILKGNRYVGRIVMHFGDKVVTASYYPIDDNKTTSTQTGTANGCGYDKETAALSRFVVDGHSLCDHCGEKLETPEGGFSSDFVAPRGYFLSNFDKDTGTYADCYKHPGLRYLKALGYNVIFIL